MVWYIFSFLNAFFESLKDVYGKKGLKVVDEYVVAWSWSFFTLPFLIPIVLFTGIPNLGNQFWLALLVGGGLNVPATILYMKAIKLSDLSITIPMITFTPLFLLLTSPLIVGEFPSSVALIGIFLIVFGSYVLNLNKRQKGYLYPFQALLKEPGPKLMLLVAFIWSITANFDKVGVLNSSALFWVLAANAFISAAMFPIVLVASRKSIKQISKSLNYLVPLGFFAAVSLVFQMIAIGMTLVAYVISIKRTSAIMSVLFGHFIFKEKGLKERLLGTIIMIIGVLLITLS